MRKGLRSSFIGVDGIGTRAVDMLSPFAQVLVSSHVSKFHVEELQFFSADHLGMWMAAFLTRRFGRSSLEGVAAISTSMAHGQYLDGQSRAFSYRAARSYRKDSLEELDIKDSAAADRKVNHCNSARRVSVRRVIDRCQNLVGNLAFVHAAHLRGRSALKGLV
jgi:hypothetical protein